MEKIDLFTQAPVIEASKPSTPLQKVAGYLSILFSLLGIILIERYTVRTGFDNGYFLGGYNWKELTFNYHPILMTSGLIASFSFALLSFRILPFGKPINKIFHILFHTASIVCVVVGLTAVIVGNNFKNKNNVGIFFPNLFSLHSFIGLAAIALYIQNYVLGFIAYFLQLFSLDLRKDYMPSHVKLGLFSLMLSLAAVVSGIMDLGGGEYGICQYEISSPDTNPAVHYHELPPGCRLLNAFGLIVVLAVLCTFFAVTDVYPRPAPPKDNFSEPLLSNKA